MIVHKHYDGSFIQVTDQYQDLEAHKKATGGYAGCVLTLPPGAASFYWRLRLGHILEYWEDARQQYIGRIVDKTVKGDGYSLTLRGCFAEWLKRPVKITISSGAYGFDNLQYVLTVKASTYWGLDNSSIPDRTDRAASYITPATTDYATGATIQQIWDDINQFDGYEYGGYIQQPGLSLDQLTQVYLRAADRTTLHYVLDGATAADKPEYAEDTEGLINRVLIYYGTTASPLSTQIVDTASETELGQYWKEIDARDLAPNLVDAQRISNQILDGQKVDGIVMPPVSIEVTINYDSDFRGIGGMPGNHRWIEPGQNILITGIVDPPRTLNAVDNRAFFHIEAVTLYQDGSTKLTCNQAYSPAVLLARLKGAAA